MKDRIHSADAGIDPLADPGFRKPGFAERIGEMFFGFSRPFECIQIEVTSICAGRCLYCPQAAQATSWRSMHMEAQTFANTWPLLRKSKRAHLQGWGEPLLHPRFFDFQSLAARAGCLTSTTSSGLVMDEARAEHLAGCGMDLVAFSLAGTDEKSNDARRGVPFAKVCQSIRMLRRAIAVSRQPQSLELHLAYLLLADRIEAAARLPDLMDELDVEMAVVSTLDYLAAPAHSELAFAPGERDKIAKAREILTKAAEKAEQSGRLLHFALPGNAQAHQGCRENIGRCFYVAATGEISPCVYLNVPGSDAIDRRRVFGNVNTTTPIEIWKSPAFTKFRKNLLAGDPEPVCQSCPKRLEIDTQDLE